MRRRDPIGFATIAALALVFAACRDKPPDDAGPVFEAVSRARLAPEPERAARLADLKSVACTRPVVCNARDTCVAAIELARESNDYKSMVMMGLAELDAGTLGKDEPRAQALPSILDLSEQKLKESHAKMKICDDSLADLLAKH